MAIFAVSTLVCELPYQVGISTVNLIARGHRINYV